jgi:glutamyl-tRNA synthetase
MATVTRFAPSPTGYLHIGGARTALFNWLYARHTGGTFRLRIEDTDKERSTDDAKRAIVDGLAWLGLDWDGEIVYQLSRTPRHAEVARAMLAAGKAYRCWTSPEELAAMREAQRKAGQPVRYDGRWRDRDPAEAPAGVPPVIRLKAPQSGDTVIDDLVQGTVRVANAQLDDMVLLRADGTPTYMLAVVVDDHDMGVTHVIRGDDHLTNAFRQRQIFDAMGWPVPRFGHIPLIHGADGAKLSKRHGALGIEAYRDMGFLPEAMRNYLLRLGWGHGDADIVSTAEAIRLFDVADIGRAPSRFDMAKLTNLNGHYMRAADDARLVADVLPLIEKKLGAAVDAAGRARLAAGMAGLKQRARTLVELADQAAFYARPRKLALDAKAAALVAGDGRARLAALRAALAEATDWTDAALEALVRAYAEGAGIKLGDAAQPLRAALSGSTQSPPIFEVMRILGRDETLGRIDDALG